MSNDYLWDKSGPPDPDVQRLEKLFGGMKFDRPLMPAEPPRKWLRLSPIAAALIVICSAAWLLRPMPNSGWKLELVQDGAVHHTGMLAAGQTVVTGATSHAKLALANFAELEVEPNSRVQLIESRHGKARMSLQLGLIHALVRAPAGNFSIATPSATAVDLGCAYTLQVDAAGNGLLRVDSGWVSFEWKGREVFIPAGAICTTHRGKGPGVPYFEESSDRFRHAVDRFDVSASTADLNDILASATKDDAFTLWHLLPRVQGDDRARIYDRLLALGTPPSSINREAILSLNGRAMDGLWDSFGLDDTTEWRKWKRPWSQ